MKHVTKSAFMRAYRKLDNAEKISLRARYLDVYRGAIFAEKLMEVERRLCWMAEADGDPAKGERLIRNIHAAYGVAE